MAPRVTHEQKRLARRLLGTGLTLKEIARAVGCSVSVVVWNETKDTALTRRASWNPAPGRLSIADREVIMLGLVRGDTFTAIASSIHKSPSTVSREVAANGGRDRYSMWAACKRAEARSKRPKPTKLASCPALAAEVVKDLEKWWSPVEIAKRLRLEHPDDPMMRVSHETIYQSLYVQGRGELRRELARCLRTQRTRRRHQDREHHGPIANMVMISERPPEVEDRAVPGHWEGDLIMGSNNRSAVGTLVERTTRFVLLLHLAGGKDAHSVQVAMQEAIATLPSRLVKTITWDQGAEMARHLDFTVATGVPVYFCEPHSPWQRGSNENTNGLLRQYLPKGTNLAKRSKEELDAIAWSLNDRPRQTLEFMKPSEKLAELIAQTG